MRRRSDRGWRRRRSRRRFEHRGGGRPPAPAATPSSPTGTAHPRTGQFDSALECGNRSVDLEPARSGELLEARILGDDRGPAAGLIAELGEQADVQRRLEGAARARERRARRRDRADERTRSMRSTISSSALAMTTAGIGAYTFIVFKTRRMSPPRGSSASSSSVTAWRASPIGVTSWLPTSSPVVS